MTALSNGWVTLWVFTATAMVPVLLAQLSLTMVLPVISPFRTHGAVSYRSWR